MATVATALVLLVALIHVYIVILEMVWWRTPRGLRSFQMDQETADRTAVLARNQGLYNGFLAAGLLWGIWLGEAGDPVKIFFLLCVAVAGIYGALTVNMRILMIQTVPAAIALICVWLA